MKNFCENICLCNKNFNVRGFYVNILQYVSYINFNVFDCFFFKYLIILFSKQQNMTIFLMYQFILFSEEHKFQLHMCTIMIS